MKRNRPLHILLRTPALSVLLCALAVALLPRESAAQSANEDFFPYPAKASVFIFVSGDALADNQGFTVYRAAEKQDGTKPANEDFELASPAPIYPLKDPADILKALGDSAADTLAQLELATPDALWDDYSDNPDKYEFLAWYSMPLSRILGRVYEDTEVESEGVYYYRIAIVDSNGKEIKKFEASKVQVTPPPVPPLEGFAVEAQDGGAKVAWSKPDDPGSAIGLAVFRSTSQDGPFERINKGTIAISSDPEYVDNTLENGKTYFYYIAALDFVGNTSSPTQIEKVQPKDMTPPAPPLNVSVVLEDGNAILTWDMNLEPDMNGYNVHRSGELDGDYTTLTSALLDSDITTYTDDTIENGKPYFYRLTAVDRSDNFSTASISAELRVPDTVPPAMPLGFSAEPAGKNTIRLKWEQSKEEDLIGYNVYRGATPDTLEQANMEFIAKDKPEYEDNGVASGKTYYYALSAVDVSMNESVLTDPPLKIIAPDFTPPQFPMGVFALAEDGRVTVSWAEHQESDVALYRLYLSFDENGEFSKLGEDITKEQLTYVDEPVENGRERWYYLTAVDEAGNESEPSSKVMALPFDQVAPEKPSAPTGTLSDKTVGLKWQPAPENDIKGYFVWRVTGSSTGVYEIISGDTVLAEDILEFTDKGLKPGVDYWYRISATDTSGNESRKSDAAGPFKIEEEKSGDNGNKPAPNNVKQ